MSSFDVEAAAIPVIETASDNPLFSEDIREENDAVISRGAPFRAQLRDEFNGDVSIGVNNGPSTVEELLSMSGEYVPADVSLDVRIRGTWYSDVESKANKFDRYAHEMELSTPASLDELEYPAISASAPVMEFLLSASWLWKDFVFEMASPADLAYLCFSSEDYTPDFDKLEKVRITEVTGLPFTVLSNIPRLNLFSAEKAPKLRDLHLEGSVTSVFVPSFLSDNFENDELEKLTLLRLSSLSHMITPFQGYSFTKLTSLKIAFNCSIVAGALEAANLLSKLVLPALEELSIYCGNETALDKRDLKSLNALDHVMKQVIELFDRSDCGPFIRSLEMFAPSTSVMQPTGTTLSNLLEKTPNLQYLRCRTPSANDLEKLCEKEKRKFKLVPHLNRCIFDGNLTNETTPDGSEYLKANLSPNFQALSKLSMLRSRSSATPLHLCVNLDTPNSARQHQSGLLSAHPLAERQTSHHLVTIYHSKLKDMLPTELSLFEGPRNIDEPDNRDDIQQVDTVLHALNKERNIPDPRYLSLLSALSLPPPPSPPLLLWKWHDCVKAQISGSYEYGSRDQIHRLLEGILNLTTYDAPSIAASAMPATLSVIHYALHTPMLPECETCVKSLELTKEILNKWTDKSDPFAAAASSSWEEDGEYAWRWVVTSDRTLVHLPEEDGKFFPIHMRLYNPSWSDIETKNFGMTNNFTPILSETTPKQKEPQPF